jgi:hypothetical protein
MNFVGLPLAVLVFLVPGFTWLLLSGLVKRLNILGTIAFSFILSICLLSLTSALLSLLTSKYLLYTIAAAAILPTVVVAAYFRQQGFRKPLIEGASISPLLLLCLVVYLVFLSALFWSTPYYPTGPDPLAHAQITQTISGGDGRSVLLHTNYPVGLHFVAAILMNLIGMNAAQSLRVLVSLVLMTGLVLIFVSAQALLGNKNLAALATLIGALALPVDAMHLVLIGTYPNLVEDAVIFAMVFVLFSYLREPNLRLAWTLAIMGLAGIFIHSSFLLFLASSWLILPVVLFLRRRKQESLLYLRACIYSTVGIFIAALVALPFLRGNIERLLEAYPITHFIGGVNPTQVLQSLAVVYAALAWNITFLIKPVNVIAIALGFILVAMKGRQSLGRIFAAGWFAILVIMSLLSGETDRFVLFSMIPAIFLVGNLVGSVTLLANKLRSLDRRVVVAAVLLILVMFGGFLPLIPIAFNPSSRLYQQDIVASMEWLQQQNRCKSGVASLGLELDFRYLPILTSLHYSGSLATTTAPDQVLQQSAITGFKCVVMQTDSPNLQSFELNQAFQERYRNADVAIFFITT